MRLLLVAALVLMAGAAVAQTASKPSAATAATPAPAKGRAATPAPALTPAQIAAREKALDAEAKKAREESERRMQARDRKLEGLMKSICKGC
ncbi:MAG: hypothetical protein ACJ8DE_08120 [Microvirga sp.]